MQDTELVYESRHGWNPRNVLLTAVGLLFTAALLLMDPSETVRVIGIDLPALVIQIPGVLLFGVGSALSCWNAASKRVALRVDSTGVLLGGSPLRYASTTVLVPWSEIAGVELWIQHVGLNKAPYVGVHRHPGLPPLPGANSRMGTALTGKSAALISASRAVAGWRLDTAALLATVQHHAPAAAVTVDPDFPARI